MIEEKCLSIGIYDYFKYCDLFGEIRGVAVITDKQSIFYTQILENDDRTHESIIIDIEEAIHPESNKKGFQALRHNNAYIFMEGPEHFVISLPDNKQLTKAQLSFINDILDELNEYNKSEDKKVLIKLTYPGSYFTNFKNSDIKEVKECLKQYLTKSISIEEEKIIGKTIDVEEIKENLKFHINFKDCNKIFDILTLLDWVEFTFTNDSYYKNIFNELFPDFKEVCNMGSILVQLCGMSVIYQKVENVTYNDIFYIFLNCVNNVFSEIQNYEQVINIILSIKDRKKSKLMSEEEIDKFLPDFSFFEKFVVDLDTNNEDEKEKINKLISNASSYKQLFREIYIFWSNKRKTLSNDNLAFNWCCDIDYSDEVDKNSKYKR